MEIREINLNESAFTQLCKIGNLDMPTKYGKESFFLTKSDIISLIENKKLSLVGVNLTVNFTLTVSDDYLISEIVKRSPLYSDIILS